jgi:hypothetical protein
MCYLSFVLCVFTIIQIFPLPLLQFVMDPSSFLFLCVHNQIVTQFLVIFNSLFLIIEYFIASNCFLPLFLFFFIFCLNFIITIHGF